MAGTKAGGKAAAATNKAKYGPDFYKKIGQKGGYVSSTGGFASKTMCKDAWCEYRHRGPHLLASCAGARGGTVSRRRS